MDELQNQTKEKTNCLSTQEQLLSCDATSSVDLYAKRVCMACQSGCFKKQKTNQRLAQEEEKQKVADVGFIFDR